MISQHSPVNAGPSTSAAAIAAELGKYNSPLAPYAQHIYDQGVHKNVDPAFFMAVCWGENHYGTVGSAITSYNWCSVSNALYGGWPVDGSRWGQYPNPQAGIDAFYELITTEYYPSGQTDLYSIWWGVGGSSTMNGSHAYAPASENSAGSLDTVVSVMNRLGGSSDTAPSPSSTSSGLPPVLAALFPANTPPAHQWGAVGIAAAIVLAVVLD